MKKNILITGSTDGIGKLTAIQFAKEGHNVYVHGRDSEKVGKLVAEIKNTTGNKKVLGFVADFSDLSQVRKMVLEVREKVSKLDVLINNAGVFKSPISMTEKGLDIRFVVNYLAPYVLTNGLLDLLSVTSKARIVNVSSAAQAPVSLEALSGVLQVSVNEAYAQSKLALTIWTMALSKRLKLVSVLAVNPGSLLNTKMANEAYGQFWAPAEKGSSILYDLAVSLAYNEMTGVYFDNDKGELKGVFFKAHPDAYDLEKMEVLVEQTEKIIKTN
ncbi:SDR family NAD(P)-dependent oxidoreductase [Flavicella sediminum]|uniref:SDR family NAD(P)-dependent oxidoreductase n=1 Tax=Flavicella sediminum TaxID=2585141 RepID=UPI00111E5F77|nr:SDR family NAD(P)-dependent oxidoreductase [Flavicella sediminum]